MNARSEKRSLNEHIKGLALSPISDVWLYRMVVATLGLVVLVCVIGAIVLSVPGKPTPEFLVALGSAAVGGLAGLLAPSPRSKS